MPVLVVVELRLKPEKRERMMATVPAFEAATRAEPGCLAFDVLVSATDPLLICSIGRWKDRGAATAHHETRHTEAMIETSLECGVEAPRFTVMDVG
jgi:quinol monooxygenase YgiN